MMKNKILIYFPDTGGYNFTPPYELLFQSKALENSGFEIILADARIHEFNKLVDIHKEQLFLVIISTLIKYTSITISRQYPDGLNAAEYVKKDSDIPVLWTGLASSILTDRIIEKHFNDYILTGISDNKISIFVQCLQSNKSLEYVPSLVYKVDGKIHKNEDDKFFNSLKDYGNFKLAEIDLKPYIHNHTLDYIASTGCVNSCSFCSVPNIYCRHWNHNSIENITEHLRHIFDKYPEIKNIHFRDDNFFVNKSFIHELFQKFDAKNIGFVWSAQTSVNILKNYTDEDLTNLRKYRCSNISLGVESGD
ncbi:MAG: radical SAM protein, partial [Bacteroidales bacterium]|nr:radical SAM protein [Bacteroidales bacterium]